MQFDKYVPTEEDISNACLSYSHDYGVMSLKEQERVRFEAKEWLEAWQKTFKYSIQKETK